MSTSWSSLAAAAFGAAFGSASVRHGAPNDREVPRVGIWRTLAGRAAASSQADSWLTQIYAKNVANTVYVSGYSGNTEYYGAPRQIGLRVRKGF